MEQNYIEKYELSDSFAFNGAFHFGIGNSHMLLSSQTGTIILLDASLVKSVIKRELSDELKFKLVQRGLANYKNSRLPSNQSEQILPKFFIIDLTQTCVMGCIYCFRHLNNDATVISDDVLDDICDYIIAYVKDNNCKRINVQPWGGEPLLAFEKAKRMSKRFRDANITAAITIQSCGVLFSEDIVKEAQKLDIRFGVSIDGAPELHNFQRPLASGKGSFDKLKNGLIVLHENGYFRNHTTISVVTKESIKYIEKTIPFFANELKLHQFKFNIVKQNPLMKRCNLELSPDDVRNFAERMFNSMVELHRNGGTAVEVNISVRILNLLKRNCGNICLSRGCMGGRKMIAFDQEGRIFTCDMTDLKDEALGSIYDNIGLVQVIENAVKTHPFFRKKNSEKCDTCPWRFYCRGGCTSSIRYSKGEYTGEFDPIECAYSESLYLRIVELFLTDPALLQSLVQDELHFFDEY